MQLLKGATTYAKLVDSDIIRNTYKLDLNDHNRFVTVWSMEPNGPLPSIWFHKYTLRVKEVLANKTFEYR